MPTIVHFEIHVATDPDETRSVLQETLTQTRAFAGNEGVVVLVDQSDARKMIIQMTWADPANYDAYLAWRQTPDGANRLRGILAAAPSTVRFETFLTIAE